MNEDFQKMMAELQKEYLLELPEKINSISSLIKNKKKDLVESEFHKLKGTGKTYGIPEITQTCELAEKACMENNPLWEEQALKTINELKVILKQYS